ncbi:MAG: PQQ-dependent sugar dehydrogenase [Microthrixaceae bacterium]
MRIATWGAGILAITGLLLSGCVDGKSESPTSKPPPGAGPPAEYVAEAILGGGPTAKLTLVEQLGDTVTAIAGSPDGSTLLVASRDGVIHRAKITRHRSWSTIDFGSPILDLSDQTTTDGERGLLNVMFSPNGSHLFVVFTALDGAVTLRTYRYSDNKAELVGDVLKIPHPFSGHNGGGLAISKDERLLISIGDMGSTRPPLAQALDNRYGKVFSLPIDRAVKGTLVTEDDPSLSLIALGLRNPWRISIDDAEDTLWIADVGEARFEEVNQVSLKDSADFPVNFGWPYFEGRSSFTPGAPKDLHVTAPFAVLAHSDLVCAITGGVVYRSSMIKPLVGKYVFGDSCGNGLSALDSSTAKFSPNAVAKSKEGITTIGSTSDGVIFAGGMNGGLYRLDPNDWKVDGVAPEAQTSMPSDGSSDELPVELCEIPEIVKSLAQIIDADAATAREAVTSAIEKLQAVKRLAPPEMLQDVESIEDALLAAADVGEQTAWNTKSPEFKNLVTGLSTGQGRWADFAKSFQKVSETLANKCPSTASGG